MGRHRTRRGQIFLLIILVLVGLIIIFGLLPALLGRRRAAPLVEQAVWRVDGQEVSTVNMGQEVEAHVVIRVVEEYVGSIVVRIKKDVSMWFDSEFHQSTIPVSLAGGEEETIEIKFAPDEASGGGLGGLRGYFIEVEFRVTRTTWEMENTYPPRLKVNA